jgi:hypothetical protein
MESQDGKMKITKDLTCHRAQPLKLKKQKEKKKTESAPVLLIT